MNNSSIAHVVLSGGRATQRSSFSSVPTPFILLPESIKLPLRFAEPSLGVEEVLCFDKDTAASWSVLEGS